MNLIRRIANWWVKQKWYLPKVKVTGKGELELGELTGEDIRKDYMDKNNIKK